MTRILVLSDTHGEIPHIEKVLAKEENQFDVCVHLGDRVWDMLPFQRNLGRFIQVKGNIELEPPAGLSSAEFQSNVELDGIRIFVTHSHQFNTHYTLVFLKKEARKRHINLVLYGHTHQKDFTVEEGITYFNPGALKEGCYGKIVIDQGQLIDAKHISI